MSGDLKKSAPEILETLSSTHVDERIDVAMSKKKKASANSDDFNPSRSTSTAFLPSPNFPVRVSRSMVAFGSRSDGDETSSEDEERERSRRMQASKKQVKKCGLEKLIWPFPSEKRQIQGTVGKILLLLIRVGEISLSISAFVPVPLVAFLSYFVSQFVFLKEPRDCPLGDGGNNFEKGEKRRGEKERRSEKRGK